MERHLRQCRDPEKIYSGKVTNWFNKIGVAEVHVESEPLRTGDDILIIGPTTGVIEMKVEDMRVNLKSAEEAGKGVYCSIAIPLDRMPEDKVNTREEMEPSERIHPRRGDKVYIWKSES